MVKLENIKDKYLDYCKIHKRLNQKTLKAYRIDLKQFLLIIPNDTLPITKENIIHYLSQIHKIYKPRTIRRKIASIKAFFNYLEYEEIIETNPLNKIDLSFRQPQRLPKTIPANTIQLFLSTLYKEKNQKQTPYQEKCGFPAFRNII